VVVVVVVLVEAVALRWRTTAFPVAAAAIVAVHGGARGWWPRPSTRLRNF